MKVILLKDVARLGRKLEVKEVPDGHALNFLIPRGLAERATSAAVTRLEKQAAHAAADRAEADAQFAAMLKKLAEETITLAAEANEQGHLFRGLHADDIVKALAAKGFVVREDQVLIEAPLKELGEHTVKLSAGDSEGICVVTITRA